MNFAPRAVAGRGDQAQRTEYFSGMKDRADLTTGGSGLEESRRNSFNNDSFFFLGSNKYSLHLMPLADFLFRRASLKRRNVHNGG